jgi:flagellar FliJ protein
MKFRFETILKLRESERDEARASLAEAHEAMRQIEGRLEELTQERASLESAGSSGRTGALSVNKLLSEGRYERQLSAEIAQAKVTAEKIETEMMRRQVMLSEANAAVRQMELLKEKDLLAWSANQERITQSSLDEIAGRLGRGRSSLFDDAIPLDEPENQETR